METFTDFKIDLNKYISLIIKFTEIFAPLCFSNYIINQR